MKTSNKKFVKKVSSAFTIVELLVVIVIIGILAAITIISYAGVSNKAIIANLQSNLSTAVKSLEVFKTENDNYPSTIDCTIADSNTNLCIKAGDSTTYTYQVDNTSGSQSYALYAKNGSNIYRITEYQPTPTSVSLICPLNFVPVPGSTTYGTSDFCVAKYEMKQYNTTLATNSAYSTTNLNYPISKPGGIPWVAISQTIAITNSQYTLASTENSNGNGVTLATDSSHLITEAEWMTIAQNVLNQSQNWSGGVVGSGYIYNGHVNNNPSSGLSASTDDGDSNYSETIYNNSSVYTNNKRTLTLTNGEVIWDLAGNVWEWTAGQTTGNQPGTSGETAYAWHEWNGVTQNGFSSSSMPASMASGTLANITSWTGTNGIGRVYSYYGEAGARGVLRGGSWSSGGATGVLCLDLAAWPGYYTDYGMGFRVTSSGL